MKKERAGKTNILLESGTNELEIVEFSVGSNSYGINVAKVKEIIRYPESVAAVPDRHPSLEGISNIRGKVIPIINLPKHLGVPDEIDRASSYVIISEFNRSTVGFRVNSVARIHRLSWKQMEAPSGMISSDSGCVTAIVKFEKSMLLLLDFEKITADINPATGLNPDTEITVDAPDLAVDRASKHILLVEDSVPIQKIIANNLKKAGYRVSTASDGQKAWDKLNSIINDETFRAIEDHYSLIISDIEMPQMDGLHLIKNIKGTEQLKSIPCIVFSSLIGSEMAEKCRAVGADSQITKPEMARLVEIVDNFTLQNTG